MFLKATRAPNPSLDQLFHAGKASSPAWPVLPASAERKETNIFFEYFRTSRHPESGAGGLLSFHQSDAQAKAMGHQGSPLTEATSAAWERPTLEYRPSCPGYLTAELEPVPSTELDKTDELTYESRADGCS